MRPRRILAATAALATVFVATSSDGSNGIHPRTPVLWADPPDLPAPACMVTVDRSTDPVLSLDYTIPYEDTDLTPDEVDDSRRHQFFAMCRAIAPQLPPPNWISEADVAAAATKDLVDPARVGDEHILDLAPEWAGCFTRITGDDERRPITFEMANMPVPFDTTGLAAGPWTVWGYTWEPPFNLWSLRPGVVNVVDDPSDDTNLPAMALQIQAGEEPIYFKGDTAHFEACVAAMDGSTVTLQWATSENDPTWNDLETDIPVMDGTNAFEFPIPDETLGMSIMLRAVITDPMDRTYAAYFHEHLTVVDIPGGTTGSCDSDGGGTFIMDPGCGGSSSTASSTSGASSTGTAGTDTDTETDSDSTGATTSGGGCRVAAPDQGLVGLVGWLLPVLIRRRRRQ